MYAVEHAREQSAAPRWLAFSLADPPIGLRTAAPGSPDLRPPLGGRFFCADLTNANHRVGNRVIAGNHRPSLSICCNASSTMLVEDTDLGRRNGNIDQTIRASRTRVAQSFARRVSLALCRALVRWGCGISPDLRHRRSGAGASRLRSAGGRLFEFRRAVWRPGGLCRPVRPRSAVPCLELLVPDRARSQRSLLAEVASDALAGQSVLRLRRERCPPHRAA